MTIQDSSGNNRGKIHCLRIKYIALIIARTPYVFPGAYRTLIGFGPSYFAKHKTQWASVLGLLSSEKVDKKLYFPSGAQEFRGMELGGEANPRCAANSHSRRESVT